MKRALILTTVLLVLDAPLAIAHRVDEYLEAATILVSRDHVRVDLRLAPGIAVASTVLDRIDIDRDGLISEAEQESYAALVRDDLSLTVDGEKLPLRLVSRSFAGVAELRDGIGEMYLGFETDLTPGVRQRKLVLENRHRQQIGAYLANSLVPADPSISITAQKRNYVQSVYELTWEQAAPNAVTLSFGDLLRWGLLIAGVLAGFGEGWRLLRSRPERPGSARTL